MTLTSIIESSNNFARKTELDIMRKQFEMFQPLEIARLTDVERMIEKAINSKKQQN